MKQISIYFGKQNDGVLGSFADVVKLAPVSDESASEFINGLRGEGVEWATIRLEKGVKYIRVENILWIDVIDVDGGQ